MTKLIMPLFSKTASGTIAKNLTFSNRKTGQQVRWQKKQKDVITSARTVQRTKFLSARDSWNLQEFGVYQFGFFLLGGKDVSISSLPLEKRAPKFACYVREFIN